MKTIFCLVTVVSLAAPGAYAGGAGTTGAAFLKVGVGARALAMGGAFSALADGANTVNWNPGALAGLKEKSLTASYNSLFVDQSQGFLGYAMPLNDGKSAVAAGVNSLTISDIEERAGDTETADSMFDNTNRVYSLSYAREGVFDKVSLGVSLKYVTEKLDSFSESAPALDIGAVYKPDIENLFTGFSVRNLGTKMGPDPLPLTLKGGAAYKMAGGKFTGALDCDWLVNDERFYVDLGGEYWMTQNLAARAGYQLGRGSDDLGGLAGASFGLGFRFGQFALDYAFVPFGDLGDTHRMTLGLKL